MEEKANKNITDDILLDELGKVYRLINNTNRRVEQKLIYIEQKVNYIMNKSATVDVAKEREIKELEQRLKKLKGV